MGARRDEDVHRRDILERVLEPKQNKSVPPHIGSAQRRMSEVKPQVEGTVAVGVPSAG